MKASKAILIMMAWIVPLCAAAGPNHYWLRALGGEQDDRIYAAADWKGHVYFGGVKDKAGQAAKGLLLCSELDGALSFEKVFVDPAGNSVHISALAAGKRALYVAGHLGVWPLSSGAFVMALDAEGEILWQKIYQTSDDEFVADLITTRDGGLLLVGTLLPPGETIGDGWVAKLDSTGSIEWQKRIGTDGMDSLADAVERRRDGYLLVGGLGDDGDPYGTLQGWILALDAVGNIEWEKGYYAHAGDAFNSVVLDRDGIWALGFNCEFCYWRNDGWIVRTDLEGNLASSRSIGDFNDMGFDNIVAARPAAGGGGFMVLGSSETAAQGSRIWVGRFDDDGEALWLRHIGSGGGALAGDGPGFDFAGALAPLKAGKTAFGGMSWDPDHQDQATMGKLGRHGDVLMGDCERVGDLPHAFNDLMEITVSFDSRTSAADSDAVVSDGNLSLDGNSPITSDEMVCYR